MNGTTRLLSLNTDGEAALSDLVLPGLSADGGQAVVDASDDRYVAGDGNHGFDVFGTGVAFSGWDLLSAVFPGGESATGSGASGLDGASLSADGRYVVFTSLATDLVPNDHNRSSDVFVRDLHTGQTLLVSVNRDGTGSGNGPSTAPAISANGRFVAFESSASDLVPGDQNGRPDVFIRDLELGQTWLISVNLGGTASATRGATSPAISADGWAVAFLSDSPDLIAGEAPRAGRPRVFVRDRVEGVTRPAGIDREEWNSVWGCDELLLAADGQSVIFRWLNWPARLLRTDLVPNDPLRHPDAPVLGQPWPIDSDVFLHELETGMTLLVSRSAREDRSANHRSDQVAISGDGRWVAYRSLATDLVAGDDNAGKDIFVYDRFTGLNTLASVSSRRQGPGNRSSHQPRLSLEGGVLVFKSSADDFIPFDYNHAADLFWRSVDAPGRMTSLVARVDLTGTGAPTLSWRAVPEAVVRVEYRDRLNEGSWQPLPATAQFESGWMRLIDPLPVAATERYYRIVLVNP